MNINYNPITSVENPTFGLASANKGNPAMVVFLIVIIVVFYILFSSGSGSGSVSSVPASAAGKARTATSS
jgi:lipopolysaccharide export LptBFGC system permease protein LptF